MYARSRIVGYRLTFFDVVFVRIIILAARPRLTRSTGASLLFFFVYVLPFRNNLNIFVQRVAIWIIINL
jgi:hypothetical protein